MPETHVATIRFTPEEHDALRAFAQHTGTSVNEAVRRAVRDFLAGPGRREEFDTLLSEAREQYRVALDKLGDV